MIIHVTNEYAVGMSILFYQNGKAIHTTITNLNGEGRIPRKEIETCDSILFKFIGMSTATIEPSATETLDYTVHLNPGPSLKEQDSFVTDNGKGLEIGIHEDSIRLKHTTYDCKQKLVWQQFKRE